MIGEAAVCRSNDTELYNHLSKALDSCSAAWSTVRDGLLANAKTIGPNIAAPAPRVTCDELRALHVPTLVLNGERTRMWYRLIGEAVAACVPGAQTGTIEGAGHMAIVENPMQTATLLTQFFAAN